MAFLAGIGGLSGAVGLIGTAVSTIGAIQQGNAAAAAAKFNAKLAKRDAQIAQQNAALEAEQIEERNRRIQGTARANIAASGITVQGSPLDVLEESAAQGEQDRLNALIFGQNNAQASFLDAQREKMAAKNARRTGFFNAAGTVASGIGSVLRLS